MKKLLMPVVVIICALAFTACTSEYASKDGNIPAKIYTDDVLSDKDTHNTSNPDTAVISSTSYSDISEISALPDAKDNAILMGATVGGFTQFYCFTPGLEYYRYESGTEKYYKGTLKLSSEYTDGEIIYFRTGAGSGEIEIIMKVTDKNGETVYLGYMFAAPTDPLNSEPSSIAIYDEPELLESGISVSSADNNASFHNFMFKPIA